jgi:hypothetical protein
MCANGVESALSSTPVADAAHRIAEQVSGGQAAQAIASSPAPLRSTVAEASRAAFVSSLNDILLRRRGGRVHRGRARADADAASATSWSSRRCAAGCRLGA